MVDVWNQFPAAPVMGKRVADVWDQFPGQTVPSAQQAAPEAAPGHATFGDALSEIRKLPEGQQAAALSDWANKAIAAKRANGGAMQGVNDFVGRLARGIPGSSWIDEAASLAAEKLNGTPYDVTMALSKANNEQNDASATKLGTLPVIG